MSIKVMSWVWDNSKTSGSKKLVLLALADNANDDGVCWPGLMTIAKKCCISRDYTKQIIKELQEEKEITVKNRPGPNGVSSTNLYTLLMGGVTPPPPRGNPASPGREAPPPTVGDPASPEPSYNHQLTIKEEEGKLPQNIFLAYEKEIGMPTALIKDKLIEAEKDYTFEWIKAAIEVAATHNARNWAYIEAVLKRWKVDGFQSNRKNGKGKPAPEPVKPYPWEEMRKLADMTPEEVKTYWAEHIEPLPSPPPKR